MRQNALPRDPGSDVVRVQFMGRPSDVFGTERVIALNPDGASLGAVRQRLAEILEDEAGAILLNPAVRAGIEDEVQPDSAWVLPGQTVFFFSVFSGG